MSQVSAATSLTLISNLATPPVASVGMVEISMAQSIAGVMYNANNSEMHSQTIQNAAVAQCCALMIAAGAAQAAK